MKALFRLAVFVGGLTLTVSGFGPSAWSQEVRARSTVLVDEALDVPVGGAKTLSAPPSPRAEVVRRRVTVQQIIIDPMQRGLLPTTGETLVELKAGDLITVIGGQRRERTEGEFWTVPAGTRMLVETEDDAAIIETTAVQRGK